MAGDLFHLIDEFAELNNVKKDVMLYFVDDQLQNVCTYSHLIHMERTKYKL